MDPSHEIAPTLDDAGQTRAEPRRSYEPPVVTTVTTEVPKLLGTDTCDGQVTQL